MKKWITVFLCLTCILSIHPGLALAEDFEIQEVVVAPAVAGPSAKVLITCRISHPSGPLAIERVAADLTHGNLHLAYPMLYDNGENGDDIPGDGVFSLLIDAGAEPGEYQIVCTVVDADKTEIQSDPVILMVQN